VTASLDSWLARLEKLHPRGIDLGLDRVRAVHEALGAPHPGERVVTVAGTNGKGSTVATMDAVLRAHGAGVGQTTSPHLVRFNERIAIDGVAVDDASIVAAFERIDAARGDVTLTYFEFSILAALDLLARAGRPWALLEVGLGGRLDAVNVVDPDVAVITAVDLDHQEWLGPDRETIGREKAGILRRRRPLVLGDPDPPASVLARARELDAPCLRLGVDFALEAEGDGRLRFRGRDARGEPCVLRGLPVPALALDDVATGLQALLVAGLVPDLAAVRRAFATVTLAGRLQRLDADGVPVVLDVAHNPHAAAHLAGRLEPGVPTLALFGTFADKDAPAMVRLLEERVDRWYLVDTPGPRGREAAALDACLAEAGLAVETRVCGDLAAGLRTALADARARPGTRVLVLGSFTVVGAALERLRPAVAGAAGAAP
jgi:dihydrofolate synthase/folylpolyglutamate synthase